MNAVAHELEHSVNILSKQKDILYSKLVCRSTFKNPGDKLNISM